MPVTLLVSWMPLAVIKNTTVASKSNKLKCPNKTAYFKVLYFLKTLKIYTISGRQYLEAQYAELQVLDIKLLID